MHRALVQARTLLLRQNISPIAVYRRNITVISAQLEGNNVRIEYDDGYVCKVGSKWLRDHAPGSLHPTSKQRMVKLDTFSVPSDVLIKEIAVAENGQHISLSFPDELVQYEVSWLRNHGPGTLIPSPNLFREDITTWGSDLMSKHPEISIDYNDVVDQKAGREAVLERLWRYGFTIVRNTPPSMRSTRIFAELLGTIKNTMFGMMWATRPQQLNKYEIQDYSDTASTNDELLPHTDGNYWRDPPGLQLFNCVQQSADGGDSVYVDGYKVVEHIADQVPDGYTETALSFFSRIPLRFYLIDPQGYHFEAVGTILRRDLKNHVVQIRHNDYDRSALSHLSNDDCHAFYAYHEILSKAIRDPNNQLFVKLSPGDMTIVDNHRVMHGRTAFKGERNMIGCYVSKDDLDSAFRVYLGKSYE